MAYDIVNIIRDTIGEVWSQFSGWYLQWLNIEAKMTAENF